MPVSKAQQKRKTNGSQKPMTASILTVAKGRKNEIKAHADTLGESVNAFINRAIAETMERDGGSSPQDRGGAPTGDGVVSLSSEGEQAAQPPAEGE